MLLRLLQCPESDHCCQLRILHRYLRIYDSGDGGHEALLLLGFHIRALHSANELDGVLHSNALHHRCDDHARAAVPTGAMNQDVLSSR